MIIKDKMPDYQKAKIYRIINDNIPGKVYYGSTTQPLSIRMGKHRNAAKSRNGSSKQLFETGKPIIVLVENFPCDTKEELHKRERYYIENNDCINKCIPGRTDAEYYKDNIEKRKQYIIDNKDRIKQYRVDNKEKISNYKRTKITCECGKNVRQGDLARHKKSKYHATHTQHL